MFALLLTINGINLSKFKTKNWVDQGDKEGTAEVHHLCLAQGDDVART